MAINPSREQKRLDTSIALHTRASGNCSYLSRKINDINEPVLNLNVQIATINLKNDAMNETITLTQQRIADGVGDMALDHEQIKAAEDSKLRYAFEIAALSVALAEALLLRDNLLVQANKEYSEALIKTQFLGVQVTNQEAALKRQSNLYPAALRRHLRLCKRRGFTDVRLGKAKK